ncbi:MAG: DMT family transporter [Alphaproteobacteria bacterium]|nr:DMT family transporter [Alphaproteobacteria bacterium]
MTREPGGWGVLPREVVILLPLLTLFWGLNWPIMKVGLAGFDVLTFRAINVAVSAFGFFLLARAAGQRLSPTMRDWRGLVPAGLMGITGWNVFILYGIGEMESGRAAILGYTMPVWATALSVLVAKAGLTLRQIVGLALGLCAMLLLLVEDFRVIGASPIGTASCILAAFLWGCGTVYIRHYGFSLSTTTLSAWMQAIGVIPIIILSLFFASWDLSRASLGPWLALLYNCTIAGVFCFYAFNRIATLVPVVISSVSTLFIPVIGVFSGMLLLDEEPGWPEFGALALVAGAIYAVVTAKRA